MAVAFSVTRASTYSLSAPAFVKFEETLTNVGYGWNGQTSTFQVSFCYFYLWPLTLFLPGEGGISPLIVYHVTTPVRNRVNSIFWYREKPCYRKSFLLLKMGNETFSNQKSTL